MTEQAWWEGLSAETYVVLAVVPVVLACTVVVLVAVYRWNRTMDRRLEGFSVEPAPGPDLTHRREEEWDRAYGGGGSHRGYARHHDDILE